MTADDPPVPTSTDGLRGQLGQRVVIWGLGIAIGYGALEQGAFYGAQLTTVVAAVALALAGWCLIGRRRRRPMAAAHRVAAGCWVALAVWALISGALAGDVEAAVPIATVAVLLAAALVAVGALAPENRATLHHVVLAAGLVVALSAWAGVALHREPWALPSQSLWRGASTITYANAAAAFLVPPLLLVGRRIAQAPSIVGAVLLTVLLVGWGSTLSRGGALSLVLGVVVALVVAHRSRGPRAGWRAPVRRLWPVVPGTALALAALLPSLPEADEPYPWLAAAGLTAGLASSAALAFGRRRGRRRRRRGTVERVRRWKVLAPAVLLLGLATGVALLPTSVARRTWAAVGDATANVIETRLDSRSSDRTDLQRVTWRQFARHPLTGVGPGQLNLRYISSAGEDVQAEFTHNEYLQLAAEVGIPGVVLAAGGIVAMAWACAAQPRPGAGRAAGSRLVGMAMVATFAVHSWLDFLWHIPAIPLLVVVTAGSVSACDSEPEHAVLRTVPSE